MWNLKNTKKNEHNKKKKTVTEHSLLPEGSLTDALKRSILWEIWKVVKSSNLTWKFTFIILCHFSFEVCLLDSGFMDIV